VDTPAVREALGQVAVTEGVGVRIQEAYISGTVTIRDISIGAPPGSDIGRGRSYHIGDVGAGARIAQGEHILLDSVRLIASDPPPEHRRTIDANLFAAVFEPGRLATLTVTLRLPRSKASGKWQGTATLDPARGPVQVLLEAQGFTLLSEPPPPVDLHEDRDSAPVAFEIRIEAAARRWLHVFLLQAGTQMGELLINDFSAFSPTSAQLPTTAPIRRMSEADLMLVVRTDDKRIEACSPRERASLDHVNLGDFQYPEQPFRELLAGRMRALYDDRSNPDDTARELQIVGVELARCLPADLVKVLRRSDIRSVMLRHEDDFDFPFELCYLDDPVDPFFVGDRIAICRWYLGITCLPDVINKQVRKVAYLKGADAASKAEETLLKQVYADRMETFERRDAVINRVLKTSEFDLLHFTGHCRQQDNATAGLEMADGSYLRVMEIGQLEPERAFGRAQPFVMLNACASAQPYLGLTHHGSFAHRFVTNNACAVVGTLWPVAGHIANEFAAEFYTALASRPIGPALLAAKLALLAADVYPDQSEPDDERRRLLLARQVAVRSYCLFASPDLHLTDIVPGETFASQFSDPLERIAK
jgi:hypothetical protein